MILYHNPSEKSSQISIVRLFIIFESFAITYVCNKSIQITCLEIDCCVIIPGKLPQSDSGGIAIFLSKIFPNFSCLLCPFTPCHGNDPLHKQIKVYPNASRSSLLLVSSRQLALLQFICSVTNTKLTVNTIKDIRSNYFTVFDICSVLTCLVILICFGISEVCQIDFVRIFQYAYAEILWANISMQISL